MKNTDLFFRIDELLPTLPGWCEPEKARRLAATVLALQPTVTVEIGVFGGKSLIPLALAHQHLGHGKVIGIDPWENAAAVEGYDGANAEWWKTVNLGAIFSGFRATLSELQLESWVEIHQRRSDDVEPPAVIDLLHVDGQHTDQAARDVKRFAARVRPGGICFMDDVDWSNPEHGTTVQSAVGELKKLGFVELYRVGTGAVFQRCT
jgi:predicted O-methyltransferase YrrM